LQRLASAIPRGAILLIEDIDCAFPSRDAAPDDDDDDASAGAYAGASGLQMAMQAASGRRPTAAQMGAAAMSGSRVTMSGILNLMDGVGSDDGRIIFATVRATVVVWSLSLMLIHAYRLTTTIAWIRPSSDLDESTSRSST
jgi:chaperone BCS1